MRRIVSVPNGESFFAKATKHTLTEPAEKRIKGGKERTRETVNNIAKIDLVTRRFHVRQKKSDDPIRHCEMAYRKPI